MVENGEQRNSINFGKPDNMGIKDNSTLSLTPSDKKLEQNGNSQGFTSTSDKIEIIPIKRNIIIPQRKPATTRKAVNRNGDTVKPFTLTVCNEQEPGRICSLNLDGSRAKVPLIQPRFAPSPRKVPVRVSGRRGVAVRTDNVPKITVQRATVVNIPLVEKVAIREIPSSGWRL